MAQQGNIVELVRVLQAMATDLAVDDNRTSLEELFVRAMRQAAREIRILDTSEDAADLVVVNFILAAESEGYTPEAVAEYLQQLREMSMPEGYKPGLRKPRGR